MINLDSEEDIEKFDKGKILASTRLLPDQIKQAWEEINSLEVPKACYLAKNVVVCGMGGSALGGRIVDSLLTDRVRVPIEVFNQYDVPYYVGKDSLVIVSSYSGNTQETVSAAHQALSKGAKVFGVTTGGKLKKLLEKENQPRYIFEPKANPSGQPRMGLGYSIAATMAILAKCGFIHLTEDDVYELVVTIREFIKEFDTDIDTSKNLAKTMARKLKNKIPVLVASEHLVGALHAFKNQLNEGAKTFCVSFDIPELNHHLMEGLRNPAEAKTYLHFLFFQSKLYSPKVLKRYALTQEVVAKNEVSHDVYHLRSEKKLKQIFEVLTLGTFTHFYLAMLYGVDPSEIPWVDYFKEKLAKDSL